MKRIVTFLILMAMSSVTLWAMPSQITFQGTLKQQGIPVNTTKNMQFSFVDGTGATISGTTPVSIANVQVTNGLFAVQLPIDPSIPWEQYTPYVRVSVEGQILIPDQPLNANVYAVAAIPQGMIAIFASNCPVGWSRFTPLDNAFPMGASSYGSTGGSATHTHTISLDGGHSHTLIEGPPIAGDFSQTIGASSPGGTISAFAGGSSATIYPIKDTTTTAPNHNHGGFTGAASSYPPYVTVEYCEKN